MKTNEINEGPAEIDSAMAVIATLRVSAIRRIIAFAILYILAAICGYLAFLAPELDLLESVLSGLICLAWVIAAEKVRRGGKNELRLFADRILDHTGKTVLWIEDIARLERGVFAMKPSNGVVITLRRAGSVSWQPGLWWRLGRKVGIGGLSAKHESKWFIDELEALYLPDLSER